MCNRRDGVVVIASVSQLVFVPLVESYQKTLKMLFTASVLGARLLEEVVENKPASSLVSLGKALNGMPTHLCGRQVAQTPRKWQLPSECGRSVQNMAIKFTFS